MPNCSVLVVEDDKSVRNLIVTTLQANDYPYTSAENGKEALSKIETERPDVLLLDLGLPDIDGIEVIKELRTWSNMPIIVISARSEDKDKIQALDMGADDYLTKPFSVLELAARIRSLLRRSKKDEKIIQIDKLFIDLDKRIVKIDDKSVELTFKEFELLKYLAKNPGRAIPREELINQVWGYDFIGESRTLDVHVNSLRKKLGSDYNNCIQSVRQVGYRFVAGEQNA